jgi:hypothetical protein
MIEAKLESIMKYQTTKHPRQSLLIKIRQWHDVNERKWKIYLERLKGQPQEE